MDLPDSLGASAGVGAPNVVVLQDGVVLQQPARALALGKHRKKVFFYFSKKLVGCCFYVSREEPSEDLIPLVGSIELPEKWERVAFVIIN